MGIISRNLNIMRITIFSLLALLCSSCSETLTNELIMEKLTQLTEYKTPFYAPFHIGSELLSGEDNANAQGYIDNHLGELVKAGLITVKISDKNSWRTTIKIDLTEAGKILSDPGRSTSENIYVQACRVAPCAIDSMVVVEPDKLIKVAYKFKVSDVTPFGTHLNFANGTTYSDLRHFVRQGGKWVAQSED